MKYRNASAFEGFLQQTFSVTRSDINPSDDVAATPPDGCVITLVHVAEKSWDNFDTVSLLFRGPAFPSLPQRTYTLSNPGFGSSNMLLVPLGRIIGDEEGFITYETMLGRLN